MLFCLTSNIFNKGLLFIKLGNMLLCFWSLCLFVCLVFCLFVWLFLLFVCCLFVYLFVFCFWLSHLPWYWNKHIVLLRPNNRVARWRLKCLISPLKEFLNASKIPLHPRCYLTVRPFTEPPTKLEKNDVQNRIHFIIIRQLSTVG